MSQGSAPAPARRAQIRTAIWDVIAWNRAAAAVLTDYGTLADFRRVVAGAHARDMRVITELVINHTSDQHPWSTWRSCRSTRGPWRC